MHANFPSWQTNINFWVVVGEGGGSTLIFWAGVSNMTQEPLLLSLHVQLPFYYTSYFVIHVQQKPTKKPTLFKTSATLHGTNTACFNSL